MFMLAHQLLKIVVMGLNQLLDTFSPEFRYSNGKLL